MTPEDVAKILVQPFYAINFHPSLAEPHKPIVKREEWIEAQIELLKDMGQEIYFETLLRALENPIKYYEETTRSSKKWEAKY